MDIFVIRKRRSSDISCAEICNDIPKKECVEKKNDDGSIYIDDDEDEYLRFPLSLAKPDNFRFEEIRRPDLHLSYCSNFLKKSVADALFRYCEKNIQYQKDSKVHIFNKWYSIRRQQIGFSAENLSYTFSGTNLISRQWPKEIEALTRFVSTIVGIDFNFVLINRYADGEDYIGEHRDNETGLDPQAPIASLSIGQCRDFVLRHENRVRNKSTLSNQIIPDNVILQLANGSLLLMRPPTNCHWYHSLPKRKKVLGTRINFTFRKMVAK